MPRANRLAATANRQPVQPRHAALQKTHMPICNCLQFAAILPTSAAQRKLPLATVLTHHDQKQNWPTEHAIAPSASQYFFANEKPTPPQPSVLSPAHAPLPPAST